jgi:hypothetical protein
MSGSPALGDHVRPFENGSEHGADAKPALREWAAQNLHMVCHESESAWRCAEIGDDYGLACHTRRLVAHAKAVAGTVNDLRRINGGGPANVA